MRPDKLSERFLPKPSVRISEIPVGGKYDLLFQARIGTDGYVLIIGGARGEVTERFQVDGSDNIFVRVTESRRSGMGYWSYIRSGDSPVLDLTLDTKPKVAAPKYSVDVLPRPGHWPLVPGVRCPQEY